MFDVLSNSTENNDGYLSGFVPAMIFLIALAVGGAIIAVAFVFLPDVLARGRSAGR